MDVAWPAVAVVLAALIGFRGVRLSERRLMQHQLEERDRVRLDAAMQAAGLFGPEDGAPATAAAKAAGLLALVELGHSDLAVALLVDVWSQPPRVASDLEDDLDRTAEAPEDEPSEVSTETAILVVDGALRDEQAPSAQLVAAELLCRNARRLQLCQSLHWPSSIDGYWLPQLGTRAKLLLMEGLIHSTLASVANENALRVLILRLYGVAAGDPDPRVKGCVGQLIGYVLPAIQELGYSEFLGSAGLVRLSDLQAAATMASPNPDGYLERQVETRGEHLEAWARRCTKCSTAPGTLAIPG